LLLLPTWAVPKLTAAGAAVSCPEPAPTPATGIVRVAVSVSCAVTARPRICLPLLAATREMVAVSVTLAVFPPVTLGAKAMLKCVLCLGVKVTGRLRPLRANVFPPTAACEMVRVLSPVLVRVADFVAVLPTRTLPKLSWEGCAVRRPAETTRAVILTAVVGSGALLAIEIVPETVPAAFGENFICIHTRPLARIVNGTLVLTNCRPLPETVTWLTMTLRRVGLYTDSHTI